MARTRHTLLTPGRLVLARRGRNTNTSYHTVRPEGTADWLLIHTVGGCGRIIAPGGECLATPGTSVLYPAGCPHDYGIAPGESLWDIQWAHFLPRDGWERLLAWPTPTLGPGIMTVSGETRDQVEQLLGIMIASASGPWPGDTVFMRARRGEFDVVVAQYHDQGLIPVKYLGVENGVNITVGLPFVRTSVDHGTAFDIAGKGVADPASLAYALKQAIAMTGAMAAQKRAG